jgi:predicted site-specific integrase-resolvase
VAIPEQTKRAFQLQSLIPPNQAAQILGVSPGTLQVWRTTGRWRLPFVKVGGRVMYRPDDIQEFVERRTMDHTA